MGNSTSPTLSLESLKEIPVVKGDPKTPFSIAITPGCRGGRYFFPWITPITLDAYPIMLSVKQGGSKYHF